MSSFDFRTVLSPKTRLNAFNPSHVDIKKDFNGNTYTFPAEGVCVIEDIAGKKWNSEGRTEDFPISASEIAIHFVGEDGRSGHLGPLGVRILSGDPVVDEQIKEEAYRVCKERMYINDVNIRNAHMAAVRVAKEGGNPPPTPERYVIEAMQRIEQYEAGGNTALPFSCPDCHMPFLNAEEVPRHQEAQHKTAPVAQAASPSSDVTDLKNMVADLARSVAALAAANAPKKPGRPRKAVEA